MIVIALRGKHDSGKSKTLKILRSLFTPPKYNEVHTDIYEPRRKVDFTSVFVKNKKRIGIVSSGDTYQLVHDGLQRLKDHKCDICICACRSWDIDGNGTNAAVLFFADNVEPFIDKTIDEDVATQERTNKKDAQKLFKIVEGLVN